MGTYSTEDLRALTEAGISLTSELSVDGVLQKVVDVARELAGARYAALGVLDGEGKMTRFLFSGLTGEERQRIGHIPEGKGLLGVLREGATLRLADLTLDPRFSGFPPNHPRMRSLLGVPIVSRGRIIGNLYLSGKEGDGAFGEREEEIVRLLSTQAAVAIENAELYETARRRSEEWKALFDLGREVSGAPRLQPLLQSAVSQARRLIGTDVAALMLLRSDDTVEMVAHEGLETAGMQHLRLLSEHGLTGLALTSEHPVVVVDYQADERLRDRPAKLVAEEGLVSQIAAPLRAKGGSLGTLTVGNRKRTHFNEQQVQLLEAFANWAAVAIETRQLYERLESLARLEERERIGMDLHDGVIQSIYAVGLHLEASADLLPEHPDEVKAALEKAIEDMNGVIQEIRSYIFDLRPQVSRVSDLPKALRQLVDNVRLNARIDVRTDIYERVDGLLDEEQALTLFHIAQEALNNVAKHSHASAATLRLWPEGTHLMLEVRDNGVGFEIREDGTGQKQGLRNMKDRARSAGADLVCESQPGRGTAIRVGLAVLRKEDSDART
jgi:two-component system sensor histidine kinase DevS